jgi:hypothetical protein
LKRVLVLTLALLAVASRGEAGLADRIAATFGLMAADVIKTFRPLEGLVVALEGDVLYLDVSAAQNVQPGLEFTVFRKGDVFRHPLTGQALGHYEEVLGYAQVRRVEPKLAEAQFIPVPGKPAPRPEDGARISRGRIKVAVTPLVDLTKSSADLRRVPFLLSTALERTKRFQVADPLTVVDMFANGARVEEILARPASAVERGKSLGVAWWLVPILLERAGVTYLDTTWISAVTGAALLSKRQALTRAEPHEEQRFPWEPVVED